MRILVTGATGYIGSRLVTALLDDGHHVIAAGRNPGKFDDYGWRDRVDVVALDAGDADSVAAALSGADPVDVIYYLVHAIGGPDFRETDNRAAANVGAAAARAGVGRIVYLGGFVPDGDDELSEHLTGRAEVAQALHVDGGAEVVWLGAAMIIGAGSTSFEMLRYVGDRFVLMPMPRWARHPIDPISIRDVLYYLVAAAGPQVRPGAYDICGPTTSTYGDLMHTYARLAGSWRAGLQVRGIDTAVLSRLTAVALPIPGGLAADLVASLDYPMTASQHRLSEQVPDPEGGLLGIEDAIRRSLEGAAARPVDQLADPHHLADTDAAWAGGDTLRIQRLAAALTPTFARPALGLLAAVPKPVAGALRVGLDAVADLLPKKGAS